jgi:Fe-S-cluster containining protein
MLGPGEEEALGRLDWQAREEDLVGATTVVTSRLPGGRRARRLARRSDGACVYLGPDHLCRIHRHFGGDRKPLMCRLYPFGFYAVGGKVAVDCSFACRSVRQGSGDPVEERVPEWSRLLAERGAPQESPHRLTRARTVSGSLLWDLEHHLLTFLSDPGLSLFDRVRCCLRFVRLATTGDPATAAAARLREAVARGLPRQVATIEPGGPLDKTQRAVFYQWLFLTLNPLPPGFDLLSGPDQRREKKRRLAAARRFYLNQGAPWIDGQETEVSFAEVSEVGTTLLATLPCPPLETFLRAKIVGQRFLVAGGTELPFVEAVPAFLLAYPMILWTAKALAAARRASEVAEDDLRRSIGLVDRTLGQASVEDLPAKVAEAWHFVVEETELVEAAAAELLTSVRPG